MALAPDPEGGQQLVLWHRDMKHPPMWHAICERCGWDKLGPQAALIGVQDGTGITVELKIKAMEDRIENLGEHERWLRDCYRHMTYHCDPY